MSSANNSAAATATVCRLEAASDEIKSDIDGLQRRLAKLQVGTRRATIGQFNRQFGKHVGGWLVAARAQVCSDHPAPDRQHEHAQMSALLLRADVGDSLGYRRTLLHFAATQKERVQASLESNIRGRSTTSAEVLIGDNADAMDRANAMPIAEVLSVEGLCAIHSRLCRQQENAKPGLLRTTNVLAGGRKNCLSAEVPRLLKDSLATAFQMFEAAKVAGTAAEAEAAAAAIALGILDVHPFRDGNGRLSRLVLSRVLGELGLPFPIVLCASYAQRKAYNKAVRAAICNLRSIHGDGGLAMRQLLQNHTQRAWHQMERAWVAALDVDRPQRDQAIQEDRKSRREGNCCICHAGGNESGGDSADSDDDDENEAPNVATLCCGVAAHLNCMSKWLATAEQRDGNPTCPNCRAVMPPAELAQRLKSDSSTEFDTTDDTTEWDATTEDGTVANTEDDTEGADTLEARIDEELAQEEHDLAAAVAASLGGNVNVN